MKTIKYITAVIIVSALHITIPGTLFSQTGIDKRLASPDEFVVGVITHTPAEEYVVAEESKTKALRLYKKDIYANMKKKGLVFKETVIIEEIEYRYKPAATARDIISEDFKLYELKEGKAVLKKEHREEEILASEEDLYFPEEEVVTLEEPLLEETVEELVKKTKAKRLVASLFYKIESTRLSDNEWEISLPTVLEAAANFGEVLAVVVDKINALLEEEAEGQSESEAASRPRVKVYLKSSLGKVSIGPNGLLIESLSSRMKKKSGLKSDDIIKNVNGKSINSIGDITSVFSVFSGAAQTVTVRILREEEELTHNYYVR
jgi:hypothetical protein